MKYIYIILLIVSAKFLSAQEPDYTRAIENLIEEIAESSDVELDYTALFDDLVFFSENPLNLNRATREDLEKIQFLNDFQIEGILEYQRIAGEMVSIYEMQVIDGFSRADIERILPFVTVGKISEKKFPNLKRAFKYGSHTLFLRNQFIVQEQKGFSELDTIENPNDTARYPGNRMKYYLRYQFDYKRQIRFGIVAEKDPGEEFFQGKQKYGFDHYTGHLQINDVWKFKSINLGDYQVRFGQGLIAWTGLSRGKSSYVMNIKKKYGGLRKYSSADENKYMRGAATTIRLGKFDITCFFSYKNIDGNAEIKDTLTDEEIVTSFQTTGMHRTLNENADRKIVSEMIYGGSIKWKQKQFKLGVSYLQYFFGKELDKNTRLYSQFDFQGDNNLNASVDYEFNYQNFYFFGETAISQNGGYATLNSALVNLAPQIKLAVLHRHYTKDYQAFYASGFGEQSGTANETGLYLGTEIYPFRNWKLSVYFDSYKFPWLRFRTGAPSTGNDFFAQLNYRPSRYVQMYLKYKQETKYENGTLEYTGIKPIVPVTKKQVRFNINYQISESLKLKNRFEYAHYKKEGTGIEEGYMIYQDINYRPKKIPLVINFRYGLFDAPYNARVYAYENDILYGYSIPIHSGRGFRTYITLKYTIVKGLLDIWLRYAHFGYSDRDIIGSSLDEIQGNNKSEVKIQIRVKL